MIVVIPCYNEADRLDPGQIDRLLTDPRVEVLFVDDGSTDQTATVLAELCAKAPDGRAALHVLESNRGKAEAVRQGLSIAVDRGADVVGYADADFATPAEEIVHLLDELQARSAQIALGSRIARLGAHIERKASRHYLGRVFATVASVVLGIAVYDTQCGAKLFRNVPALRHALTRPFSSRWSFDVELLGRLLTGGPDAPAVRVEDIIEIPLRTWVDIPGSKLSLPGATKAGLDLIALGLRVQRRGSRGFFPD